MEESLRRAVDGDEVALGELLAAIDGPLRTQLCSKISDKFRSDFNEDDILQITYLEVFLRIAQFNARGIGSFRAWVLRIAENNLRDAIRGLNRERRPPKNKRLNPPGDADAHDSLIVSLAGSGSTPSRAYAQLEAKEVLEAAIGKLPEDYQTVVRLCDIDRLRLLDVAAKMGRSVGAIHMLRCRAHDRLAEILGSSTGFYIGQP
ncbi:MAG: RNA polymerase sigma factor [Planctomycetota bacterium]|jgi:RNA polymerase sigma-70 factor (ECF subfamily)